MDVTFVPLFEQDIPEPPKIVERDLDDILDALDAAAALGAKKSTILAAVKAALKALEELRERVEKTNEGIDTLYAHAQALAGEAYEITSYIADAVDILEALDIDSITQIQAATTARNGGDVLKVLMTAW